eukprot:scaffold91456_cov51-Phaeocystis_antarctica.AAC.2
MVAGGTKGPVGGGRLCFFPPRRLPAGCPSTHSPSEAGPASCCVASWRRLSASATTARSA